MKGFLSGRLKSLNQKELAILIRALLDRYPIIVTGDSEENIDLISESLINLVPHRREVVFGTDFIRQEEYEQLINHEKSDYNGERLIFRAPSSLAFENYQPITPFRGWVIAVPSHIEQRMINSLNQQAWCFLILRIRGDRLSLQINDGHKWLNEVSFEEKLLDKVLTETEMKIERISRVLKRAARGKVSERLEKSLIDLDPEEERVRQSLFREHVLAFVQAAWRILVILQRLRLLEGVGVKSVISEKMLRQAIDYKGAAISRLMEFIQAEWGEDFRSVVEGGRDRSFGDRLEGYWTV
jgi:hypothetical protein